MSTFGLVWDLSSGRAVLPPTGRGADIPIASVHNPQDLSAYSVGPYSSSGQAVVDVFGLDRRMALVVSAFFRRADWYPYAGYDNANLFTGKDGEGWSCNIGAYALRRDGRGAVHQINQINPVIWLSGGVFGNGVGDGCEIVDGGDGVRLIVAYSVTSSEQINELPAWTLCLALELKANVVLGCSGLSDAIVAQVQAKIPQSNDLVLPVAG